jgi:hypothetical protein
MTAAFRCSWLKPHSSTIERSCFEFFGTYARGTLINVNGGDGDGRETDRRNHRDVRQHELAHLSPATTRVSRTTLTRNTNRGKTRRRGWVNRVWMRGTEWLSMRERCSMSCCRTRPGSCAVGTTPFGRAQFEACDLTQRGESPAGDSCQSRHGTARSACRR